MESEFRKKNLRYFAGKPIWFLRDFIYGLDFKPLRSILPIGIDHLSDLRWFAKRPIETLFDVGANVGQTTNLYGSFFPQATVYSFEPIAETFEKLEKNTAHLSRNQRFHCALGSQSEEVQVFHRENSQLVSLNEAINVPGEDAVSETVSVRTLDSVCEERGIDRIDILKMDTEGYELEVLKGAENMLNKEAIRFVYSEITFEKSDSSTTLFSTLYDFLAERNFYFSSLYEVYRWGANKRYFGFCNALFVHNNAD